MEISDIRTQIDTVNDELLQLFMRRMELSEQVAQYKIANNLPVLDRQREREILSGVAEKAGAYEPYAYQLFTTMMELSKARQGELYARPTRVRAQIERALLPAQEVFPHTGSVACQGVEGSNSQAACDKLLPRGRIMYVKTFDAVFDAVKSGLCNYGVLPIENSSNGSVRAVYDLLQRKHFSIVRATSLCIRHELLANPGVKLSDIKEIYSHEQALGQCSAFLSTLKGVKLIPCANTALAAKQVAESGAKDCAAISSHPCAALYGLDVIGQGIQNSDNNYTRFICIAKEPVIYEGANRISVIFSCDNKPGALFDVLAKLSARGINMSKLESCPVVGRNFEFVFFMELDASVREPGVMSMLDELERMSEGFIFLGCYAMV